MRTRVGGLERCWGMNDTELHVEDQESNVLPA
jgi:hypothetical protein